MKRIYIVPLSEVMPSGADVIMQAFGPSSMPDDPFNQAPAHQPRKPKAF